MHQKPFAILFDHPDWFAPLFAELDRRSLNYHSLQPADLGAATVDYALIINRVGALPQHDPATSIRATLDYLKRAELAGTPIINGFSAHQLGIDKVAQQQLITTHNLFAPRSVAIQSVDVLEAAAEQLCFPLLFKPNIGGSGTGIQQFPNPDSLYQAKLDFGVDGCGLLQEYHPPKNGRIYRLEVLDGKLLYALSVPVGDASFNLCPADGCDIDRFQLRAVVPPEDAVLAAETLITAAQIHIGGIEYLESERDGRRYFYDINPLSNFVADAGALIGFDPYIRFVDYLQQQLA